MQQSSRPYPQVYNNINNYEAQQNCSHRHNRAPSQGPPPPSGEQGLGGNGKSGSDLLLELLDQVTTPDHIGGEPWPPLKEEWEVDFLRCLQDECKWAGTPAACKPHYREEPEHTIDDELPVQELPVKKLPPDHPVQVQHIQIRRLQSARRSSRNSVDRKISPGSRERL